MAYTAKMLRVNLSTNAIKEELIPEETMVHFIGGRGLGISQLYRQLRPGVEPLSPDNKLLLLVGPLAGTGGLACSRWMAVSKSPLTGTYFRSVSGGDFGAWLSFTGLQLILLEGRAAKPVYLYIEGRKRELRDAGELWGKGTVETQESLKASHGDGIRAVCIGPAGEKLVRFASIASEHRHAGRGGMGTVMGSKNLKAVVIKARHKTIVPWPQEFKAIIREQSNDMKGQKAIDNTSKYGTSDRVDITNTLGIFPVRNFHQGVMENWKAISLEEYDNLRASNKGCYACPVRCGQIRTVKLGTYSGATSQGTEYETTWAFSGPTNCHDIGATIAADVLCDDLGIDTISTGNALGFAWELFEKGILTKEDTDGLSLNYGDHEVMLEMVRKIGNREGLGDMLAEGTKRAAAQIGKEAEAYAMQIKGLELPGYDPRGAKRLGLGYITSNIGGSHTIAYVAQELVGTRYPRPVDRFADTGDADIAKLTQDTTAWQETGIGCIFVIPMLRARLFARMLVSATGAVQFGEPRYLFHVGERIYNLERAFNIREGFSRKDDIFPPRFTTEPLEQAGLSEGQMIRKPEVLLDEYYQLRGWDSNGIPTPEKLRELGLESIIEDIKK
ncbi:MAG: aldehyde ferredoxin oxidoreductase family protein [Dehalococcoidia bacterium]|nr:aldehyde ferredoxin oxidoreductase family protein [Dehalococcoidia bacterium]